MTLLHYTTKSRDSEQTSFCARYSEQSLNITENSEQILNITENSEQSEHYLSSYLKSIYFTSFSLDFN
jgi:repressor of nif and glnA expression